MRQAVFAFFVFSALPAMPQKFRSDDPLLLEPPPMPVEKVLPRKFSDYFDFFYSTFGEPGDQNKRKARPVPAMGVNTLGEPMAGAWWEPRHYYRRMSIEELIRGPGNSTPPAEGPLTVVKAKTEGITPGFDVIDSKNRYYFVKFDPVLNPEIATAPDVLVGKIFYALGYHTPQNYIFEFAPESLVIKKDTKVTDRLGKQRAMTRRDINEILLSVPKTKNGKYRAVASLRLDGSYAGPYRFWGARKDDPNDIVPHEHRRDLRGLSVACAWLGHDDSRSINTLDFVVEENGRRFVKHFLIDFGSTLGSATDKPNSPRSGFEYLFEWAPAGIQFFSLGLAVPGWARAHFPNIPSVGRFEYERFDPLLWKAEYPNPAFSNRLPDDEFWMAKQIAAFTDEELKAIVQTGQYSDQRASDWVLKCLIQRRDKIKRAFLARVLPLDRFRIENGTVVFDDLGALHGLRKPGGLETSWSIFDNRRGTTEPVKEQAGFLIPAALNQLARGGYAQLEIVDAAEHANRVSVYLRKTSDSFEIVGIDRKWKTPVVPPAP